MSAWGLLVVVGFAASVDVDVGSLFNFLGFFFGVFAAAAVTSSVLVDAAAFFVDDVEAFAAGSCGNITPPADPALPCSVWLGVTAFLERACLAGVADVALGPGDDDFDAIVQTYPFYSSMEMQYKNSMTSRLVLSIGLGLVLVVMYLGNTRPKVVQLIE
jgi:hypothetical protein